jgi:hypothetical protein
LAELNIVVLEGMAKARQPSLLLVAVTNFGVVAAIAVLGGAVLVPEAVPPLELPPLELPPLELPPLELLLLEDEPPLEPVPVGGGVVVPLAVVSVVDPPEFAALLEPQALSAARQTIEIAGKIETRSFEAKVIATCIHRTRVITRNAGDSRSV